MMSLSSIAAASGQFSLSFSSALRYHCDHCLFSSIAPAAAATLAR